MTLIPLNRPRRGFTLAELLIVVAIIAVLTAIAIPVFTKELEKSREATDLSNIRAAYAEVMADAITGDVHSATVDLRQTQAKWQMGTGELAVGGVPYADWIGEPAKGGTCIVSCDANTLVATITFDDGLVHNYISDEDRSNISSNVKTIPGKTTNSNRYVYYTRYEAGYSPWTNGLSGRTDTFSNAVRVIRVMDEGGNYYINTYFFPGSSDIFQTPYGSSYYKFIGDRWYYVSKTVLANNPHAEWKPW